MTLTNVLVTDPKVKVDEPAVTLLPGGDYTFHGTYTLTQADLDAGLFTNKATVKGTPPSGVDLTAESTVTKTFTQSPAIELVKTGTQSLNIVAPNGKANVGDKITYTFKVTNKGNVTLTNVIVSDTNPFVTINDSPIVSLAPGDANAQTLTGSFTLTQAVIDAGTFTNTATATGTPPVGGNVSSSDDDTQTITPFASMTLVKTGTLHQNIAGLPTVTDKDDTITYTFAVKNTGNVTLSNITLSDLTEIINGTRSDPLAPDATDSTTFTATHVLTQAEINSGKYDNTATTTAKTPKLADVQATDTESITGLATPSLSLVKTGTWHDGFTVGRADAGETITYTFTVTNTGNVPLTNVYIVDPKATISGGPILSLAIGAIDTTTFTGTYTLLQSDVDAGTFTNSAKVNGTPPTGTEIFITASDTKALPAVRSITLDKTGVANLNVVKPDGIANAGDTVTYSFYVTNPGNVTLKNVHIVDAPVMTFSPPPVDLDPGGHVTFTATYALTQANVNSGTTPATFINNATAYGTPPLAADITATDSDSKSWAESPSIMLEKTGTLDMTVVAPTGVANVGDKINYTFKVTNTGNVTLSGVTVSDTNPSVSITGASIGNLNPGVRTITGSYTLTQADVDAGTFTNTASVTGKSPINTVVNASDDDTKSFPASPSIALVKTGTLNQNVIDPPTMTNIKDTITYTFTVTNTGNVTLHNITLTDPKISVVGGPTIASLAPGASSTVFTGTYILTQTDISAGSFTNTATTTGFPPTGNSVSGSDDDLQNGLSTPSISLVKSAVLNPGSNSRMDEGDTITYHFTVTNTGNVPLTNVSVTDPKITVTGSPISLGVGLSDTSTFSGTYTVSQAEINAGTISNTATATGTPPIGTAVTATSTVDQALDADKKIALIKTGTLKMDVFAPNDIANEGDTITYTFTVTNQGNVPLTGVVVTDPKATITGGAISLNPGEMNALNFTGTYTLTQDDLNAGTFTNTAKAEGTPPIGVAITTTASDTKDSLSAPSVSFVKTGTVDMTVKGLPTVIDEGDKINYTFTITNTGNVPLTHVMVTDSNKLISVTGSEISLGLSAGDKTNTTSFTASYTLTQKDINQGSFTNTATVTAKSPTDITISKDSTFTSPLTQIKILSLIKQGTLNKTVVKPDDEVNVGDKITYTFAIKNEGNVVLTDITLDDHDPDVVITESPTTPKLSLAPGEGNTTRFTGVYTIEQADIDAGTYTNTAEVTGTLASLPDPTTVVGTDDYSEHLADRPLIGVAKRVVSVQKVSAGTHDVTFEILVKNYGNVTLHNITITDDLAATFPLPTTFKVKSITAADPLKLKVNPAYNGSTDINLLLLADPLNTLDVGESKVVTVVVTVIPTAYGPFMNTANGSGLSPAPINKLVTDISQAGIDPDPDKDKDPTNNNEQTSANFTARIFDPPYGIKTLDAVGEPYLKWTMVWINESNIVGVHAIVHDPIPEFTKFEATLITSGYGVPATAPAGSTSYGVSCTPSAGSKDTITTLCYYEGPTAAYPRGQIIWEGTLGPDLGVTDPTLAKNAIYITFGVRVNDSTVVKNNAFIDSDLNGDGDALDDGERTVAIASFTWDVTPSDMPETGFAPNQVSLLPYQTTVYKEMGDLWLEIPDLGIKMPIVGIPMRDNQWDVSWLDTQAGWLNETAYPTTVGNSVITGHVYLPNGKPGPFVDLHKLGWNDRIIIHEGAKHYIYRVRQVKRVKPNDVSALNSETSTWVTLITCQGYDEKSDSYLYRQVVRAELVEVK